MKQESFIQQESIIKKKEKQIKKEIKTVKQKSRRSPSDSYEILKFTHTKNDQENPISPSSLSRTLSPLRKEYFTTKILYSKIRSLHINIKKTKDEIHDFSSSLSVRTRKQVVMTEVITKKRKNIKRK